MSPAFQPCRVLMSPLTASSIPVLLLVFSVIASPTPAYQEEPENFLRKSGWDAFLKSEENDGVEVVWTEEGIHEDWRHSLNLVLHGERISLRLRPADGLLDPRFALISRRENSSTLLDSSLAEPHCHFVSPHRAALHLCRGISGLITSGSGESYYLIQPLEGDRGQRAVRNQSAQPHLVLKRSLPVDTVRKSPQHRWRRRGRRRKRANPREAVHIETAVFVDRDLFSHMSTNFPQDTERELVRFVLTMVNAVEMLYHDPSLGQRVNFVVKRLEILHAEPPGLVRSHDIDRFLGNFCSWQGLENPGEDSDPLHWDHALILTGLDLYVINKSGKMSKQVVGLAPVAGMCTATSSCTVNEGRHFESVYVVAHEIGHNLGMRHDGPLAENTCDPAGYLMSATLGSGKITWSSCSRAYLRQFLQSPQSHCLMDGNTAGQLDHRAHGLLPGERFSSDQQCMLKYGNGSTRSPVQSLGEICRDLHCTRDKYIWTSHPALEGTPCGVKKWCRGGRCVGRDGVGVGERNIPSGGWTEWSPFSDCASGCLTDSKDSLEGGSSGVRVASRVCTQPRPEGEGISCVGSDKKYRTCKPNQCGKVPRTSIRSFADEVCLRAREVDPELIGTGLQKISANPEEACRVWCEKKTGGAVSRSGWLFPDGTTCQTQPTNKPLYCISGVCQEFRCSSDEDEIFTIPKEACSGTMQLYSRDKRREVAVDVWRATSDCYSSCVSPGSGLRLVEKRSCRYCNLTSTIQLCQFKKCSRVKTPGEEATEVCTRLSKKVRRLSGLGVQLPPTSDDPDRPCRLACQDELIHQRFYMVNGEDGWYPFGTDCARGDPTRRAYCVSGRCLEFGSDNTPIHERVRNLIELTRRKKRESGEVEASYIDYSQPIQLTEDIL